MTEIDPPMPSGTKAATVADLAALLATLPQGARIVLAKDSEGNGFSPLAAPVTEYGYSIGRYEADSTWSGEFYSGDGVEAVCLWPTN